jgi:hypothetical protein
MQGVAVAALFLTALHGGLSAQTRAERRLQERMDEANRREADALVQLADDAAAGKAVPADFALSWRQDFLKAQPGTFVPFTVTIDRSRLEAAQGLMYVRAMRVPDSRGAQPAFDAVFPVALNAPSVEPLRVRRGFAVPPGQYEVFVTLRERPADPLSERPGRLKAAVLRQSLTVPDFWTDELATSSVMLADRIEAVPRPLTPDEIVERPYVIGQNDVHIASDSAFRKTEELIVVLVVYNPSVTPDKLFDIQVDYHLFYKVPPGSAVPAVPQPPGTPQALGGERYVTRTDPQRFNPSVLGGQFDPAAGHPIMAGQGILLSSFQEGEYRLAITVTDRLSRKTLSRDVTFTVTGS